MIILGCFLCTEMEKVIDITGLLFDDLDVNVLDWGSKDVLTVALGNSVFYLKGNKKVLNKFVAVEEGFGCITSLNWAPNGQHLAIGLSNSDVQIWDFLSERKVRTLGCGHGAYVGSLAWNRDMLATGSNDGLVVMSDFRKPSHVIESFWGHEGGVCGLQWSDSGSFLASGGSDCCLNVWDIRKAASSCSVGVDTNWLHSLEYHVAPVRALAWCPFQSGLLASGGAAPNCSINLFDTNCGSLKRSIATQTEVCALLWRKNGRELLCSNGTGSFQHQIISLRYPEMRKALTLEGHTSRVLFMAQSPDGSKVASAGSDQTLRLWSMFQAPVAAHRSSQSKSDYSFGCFNIR